MRESRRILRGIVVFLAVILIFQSGFIVSAMKNATAEPPKIVEQTSTNIVPEVQGYSNVEGIITFRGNNLRNAPSYGTPSIVAEKIEKVWELRTSSSSWGGGAGWTGQPAIVRWTAEQKAPMNIAEKFKKDDSFVEVIYASLDGNVYFIDLKTGEQTRPKIKIGNPIKGSVSVDSRGYPLLYVGEGIPENKTIGFNIFSLIDGKRLFRQNGYDKEAYRSGWGANDGSALFLKETDELVVGSENSILYKIKLNTKFDGKTISINPVVSRYKYKFEKSSRMGIENSIVLHNNVAYFADNDGYFQGVDITTMKAKWKLEVNDDTDSTTIAEIVDNKLYLYTGNEIDHRPSKSPSIIRKIDAETGKILWEAKYPCLSTGSLKGVNGGAFATGVVGKGDISNMVIYTLSRYKTLAAGIMVSLDKSTGKELWRWEMPNYAWSSPVDVYSKEGKVYLIQGDSVGNVHLMNAKTGARITKLNLGANIESSPAVFENYVVVATRGGKIFGMKLK